MVAQVCCHYAAQVRHDKYIIKKVNLCYTMCFDGDPVEGPSCLGEAFHNYILGGVCYQLGATYNIVFYISISHAKQWTTLLSTT